MVVFNLLATTCAENEKCEVTLESASWLNWFGGIPNVGGTDYSIKFLSQACENLKIDSVFIDGKSLKFQINRTEYLWEIAASKSHKKVHKQPKSKNVQANLQQKRTSSQDCPNNLFFQ